MAWLASVSAAAAFKVKALTWIIAALANEGVMRIIGFLGPVNNPTLDAIHVVAHMSIFLAYVGACLQVPPTFARLIHVRQRTKWTGGGFFLLCGMTHFANAFGFYDYGFVHITDISQAGCIIGFLIFLSQDIERGLDRFEIALAEMGDPEAARKLLQALRSPTPVGR